MNSTIPDGHWQSRIIDDSHTAADTEELDAILITQGLAKRDELRRGLGEGLGIENLRADVGLQTLAIRGGDSSAARA